MTIQIAQLTFDYKTHPEMRDAYLDLSGFLKIEFLKEVLRKAPEWDAKGITYTIVAEYEAGEERIENRLGDLEEAFRLTNTIDRQWWENEGITPKFKGDGCRSTSVGDLMFCAGRTYVVGRFGFEEVVL